MDDGRRAVDDAALEVARAELRKHLLLQDQAGKGVGQHWLQAIADLDADLVLGGDDDEQGAVVLALLADAPGAAELVAVVVDGVALQRGQGDHHHLATGPGLQVRQFLGDLLLGAGRQHMGVIDHAAGQRREGEGRVGEGERESGENEGAHCGRQPPSPASR